MSCKLIYTPFGDVDQFSARAVDCCERTLQEAQRNGTRVPALVIANPHNPLALSVNLTGINKSLVHDLYGFSKDFAAAGLRLGCLISRNGNLTRAVRSLARFHWTSPMTDAIATTILEGEKFHSHFLTESHRTLKEHRAIAAKAFDNAGIPYVRNA
ncbi:hypothetical protein N0V86_008690 [Didymella sp. IMI 355093]|nr:hypothetical protein N0V86_008690 [Didymella sp. IMI 355093]